MPAKYPLYGRDAHRTRAGIHADGLNKFWWMYAPFDVPRLLGLYRSGDLKLDELITRRYRLDQVNEGYQDMLDGKNVRGVIIHEH